jgi:hypothetical protein
MRFCRDCDRPGECGPDIAELFIYNDNKEYCVMKGAMSKKDLARAKQSVNATCCTGLSAVDERERLNRDWRALRGPVTVVEVVEVAAEALPKHVGAAKSQATVRADREARSVNGASLGGFVKLELVVGRNVSGTAGGVGQDTVAEGHRQSRVGPAGNKFVWGTTSGGSGARGSGRLRLTLRFLRDGRCSARALLWLAIHELASSTLGLGRHHRSLWLSVRDDGDWHVSDCRSLWLTI